MPIRMYSKVHTGPKIQLGGLKDGLTTVLYQPPTAVDVNKPATAPTANGKLIAIINFIFAFIFFLTKRRFFYLVN